MGRCNLLHNFIYADTFFKKFVLNFSWANCMLTDNLVQDDSSGFDKEEIERAIALSLSVEDQKGKKVIGKLQSCKHWLGSYSQF